MRTKDSIRRFFLFRAPAALVFSAVAALACLKAADADWGFHLATARAMLEHHGFPPLEPFGALRRDQPFMASYALGSLLLSLGYWLGGAAGLSLWKMLLCGAAFTVVSLQARPRGVSPWAMMVAVVFAAAATRFRFLERPYLFSAVLLAALDLVLVRHVVAGRERFGIRTLALMVAGSAVWSFIHPEWFDGVALVLMHGFALCLSRPGREAIAASGFWRLIGWLGVAVAVPFCLYAALHPGGVRALAQPVLDFAAPFQQEHIAEYQPLEWSHLPMTTAYASAVAAALGWAAWRRNWRDLLVGAVFGGLAARNARVLLPAAIVAAPVLAEMLDALASAASRRAETRPALRIAFALACVGAIVATSFRLFCPYVPGIGREGKLDPRGVGEFMERHNLLREPVFCALATGSAVLEVPAMAKAGVFLDGRFEVWGPDYMRDVAQPAFNSLGNTVATLNKLNAGSIVMNYFEASSVRWEWFHGLVEKRQCVLVHWDDFGVVLVPPDVAKARGLRELKILPEGAVLAPGYRGSMEQVLEEATLLSGDIARSPAPHTQHAWLFRAYAADFLQRREEADRCLARAGEVEAFSDLGYYVEARIHLRRGEIEEGFGALDAACRANRGADLRCLRGLELMRHGLVEEAIVDFEAAIADQPENTSFRNAMREARAMQARAAR